MKLETLFKFAEESLQLIENSRFKEKIELLLDNPDYGEIRNREVPVSHPVFDQPPNCFGTLAWIIDGDNTTPQFMDRFIFERKYTNKKNRLDDREKDSIVVWSMKDFLIVHAGLYIGTYNNGISAIIHQPGIGNALSLDPLEKLPEWYPTIKNCQFDFYRIPKINFQKT